MDSTNHSEAWNNIYLILAAVKCFLILTIACSYYCYRRHLERISALLPHIRLISDLTRFDPFMIESEATVMNELETVIQVPHVSEIGAVGYKYSKFFRRLTRGFGGGRRGRAAPGVTFFGVTPTRYATRYKGYRKITGSSNVELTTERSCPEQPACPAIGGSEVTFGLQDRIYFASQRRYFETILYRATFSPLHMEELDDTYLH
ncbi:hypothetical protein J6590_072653 [Homalodisca vitripennis]|nr:hypothetical protein J6590_072653 [Homalodisca vitripennis]